MAKKTEKSVPIEVPVEEFEQRVTRLAEPPPMQYVALVGLNYGPDDARIEPGGEVPAEVVKASPWLLTDGHVVQQGA